jgi:hypothetical protein
MTTVERYWDKKWENLAAVRRLNGICFFDMSNEGDPSHHPEYSKHPFIRVQGAGK